MSLPTYMHFINESSRPGMCAGRGVHTPSLMLGKGVKLDVALCWMEEEEERSKKRKEEKEAVRREEAASIPEKVKGDGLGMSENRQLHTEPG